MPSRILSLLLIAASSLPVAILSSPVGGEAAQSAPERWNIISIVTDDQAQWSVGAYGNREARTPNMDRLAREGARFLNAFTATPVCSPSRASFLTGRYGTQVGITDWITSGEASAGPGLPREATTWPEVLQQRGYRTALIGKWHLRTLPQFHPMRHGFHHFFGFLAGGSEPMHPTLEVEGEEKQLQGSKPDLLVDDALQFIEANRARPSPCCCISALRTFRMGRCRSRMLRPSESSTRPFRRSGATMRSRSNAGRVSITPASFPSIAIWGACWPGSRSRICRAGQSSCSPAITAT